MPIPRLPFGVCHRNHHNEARLDGENEGIWESRNETTPKTSTKHAETKRHHTDIPGLYFHRLAKTPAKPRFTLFVVLDCGEKLCACVRVEYDATYRSIRSAFSKTALAGIGFRLPV
jgi:hypothetical protein